MLIDTHCHLNFQAFADDLPQVIQRARERGVGKIIIPGTDLASSKRAIEIAQQYPDCWAAVGIHPHHAQDPTLRVDENLRRQLHSLLTQKKVVAAGEIGIDYYQYRKTKYAPSLITEEIKQKQQELFLMQLELALAVGIPAILHCRDAHKDMIKLIQTISSVKSKSDYRETSRPFPGVFHCWGGSKKQLRLLITIGYYIGFDGNISYSPDWAQFVAATPLDRLVLETDAPYLAPVPHRGTRNEPAHLPLVAEYVAKYQGIPLSRVVEQTTNNAERLFKLN